MPQEKYTDKFIGSNQIEKVELIEDKTFLEKPKVMVFYKNEYQEVYPEKVLESIVTDDKSDATELREKRVAPVVKELLVVLAEAELTMEDAAYAVMSKVKFSLDDSIARAAKLLWGKEVHEITLMDIDDVLKGRLVAGRIEK